MEGTTSTSTSTEKKLTNPKGLKSTNLVAVQIKCFFCPGEQVISDFWWVDYAWLDDAKSYSFSKYRLFYANFTLFSF